MNFEEIKNIKYSNAHNPANFVSYRLWVESDDKSFDIPDENQSGLQQHTNICFRALGGQLDSGDKPNRILYKPEITVDPAICKEWVRICTSIGLLPSYVRKMDWEKNGFVFDTHIPRSLLYVYLCNARHMKEEFDLVNAAVALATKFNLEPHAAIIFATKVMTRNSGHGYVPEVPYYWYAASSERPCLSTFQIKLKDILGFRNFILEPSKYDTKMTGVGANTAILSAIQTVSHFEMKVSCQDLAHEVMTKAVSDVSATKKCVDEYARLKAA